MGFGTWLGWGNVFNELGQAFGPDRFANYMKRMESERRDKELGLEEQRVGFEGQRVGFEQTRTENDTRATDSAIRRNDSDISINDARRPGVEADSRRSGIEADSAQDAQDRKRAQDGLGGFAFSDQVVPQEILDANPAWKRYVSPDGKVNDQALFGVEGTEDILSKRATRGFAEMQTRELPKNWAADRGRNSVANERDRWEMDPNNPRNQASSLEVEARQLELDRIRRGNPAAERADEAIKPYLQDYIRSVTDSSPNAVRPSAAQLRAGAKGLAESWKSAYMGAGGSEPSPEIMKALEERIMRLLQQNPDDPTGAGGGIMGGIRGSQGTSEAPPAGRSIMNR